MSGIVKSVKRVFKKVVKNPIGAVVLGAGVAFFTAGLGTAALGAMGASSAFTSGTLGTVLSHAISGTVAGAGTAALTGGNIAKGALFGGAGGALMGGARSFLGGGGEPGGMLAGREGDTQLAGGANGDSFRNVADPNLLGNQNLTLTQPAAPLPGAAPLPAASPAPAASTGMLGWLERNPEITGRVLAGAAEGGLGMMMADEDSARDAYYEGSLQLERQQYRDLRSGYSNLGGMLTPQGQPPAPPNAQLPAGTPQVRYQWNPTTRRIEAVPMTAPA